MEKYNFVGKNLTSKKIENATQELDEVREKNSKPNTLEREVPASIEDIESTKHAINLVRKELIELGLGENFNITENQVHFIEDHSNAGSYDEKIQQILIDKKINKTKEENVRLYNKLYEVLKSILFKYKNEIVLSSIDDLVHENTHGESYQKYLINKENKPEFYRTGYVLRDKNNTSYLFFRGLNEAVVEKTTLNILSKYIGKNLITKKIFGFLYKEKTDYKPFLSVVEEIVKNISKKKKIPESEVWNTLIVNQFTGNMMHLRVIEEVYGKGALRILASLGSNPRRTTGADKPQVDRIYEFFKKPRY